MDAGTAELVETRDRRDERGREPMAACVVRQTHLRLADREEEGRERAIDSHGRHVGTLDGAARNVISRSADGKIAQSADDAAAGASYGRPVSDQGAPT